MFDLLVDNPIVNKIEDLKFWVQDFLCYKPAKLWRWGVVTLIVVAPLLLASFDYGGRPEAGTEAVLSRNCTLLSDPVKAGSEDAIPLRAGSAVRILATAPA